MPLVRHCGIDTVSSVSVVGVTVRPKITEYSSAKILTDQKKAGKNSNLHSSIFVSVCYGRTVSHNITAICFATFVQQLANIG